LDTPYKELLFTNILPSDEECRRIRDFVVAPMKEVEELTKEITGLTQKRDRLAEFIDSHLALVSSARKVPHDILREIFAASLPSGGYAMMRRMESPLLGSHVCNDWQSLALSMPQLWASLHITVPPRN
ncbi:hypothetical protein C8R44DRAFT_546079, partial [Mycena epipterygia]